MKCSSTQAGPSMAENDLYISGDAAQLVPYLAVKGREFENIPFMIESQVTAARARKDIAVMPLGAGGPGANLIAVSAVYSQNMSSGLTSQMYPIGA